MHIFPRQEFADEISELEKILIVRRMEDVVLQLFAMELLYITLTKIWKPLKNARM